MSWPVLCHSQGRQRTVNSTQCEHDVMNEVMFITAPITDNSINWQIRHKLEMWRLMSGGPTAAN